MAEKATEGCNRVLKVTLRSQPCAANTCCRGRARDPRRRGLATPGKRTEAKARPSMSRGREQNDGGEVFPHAALRPPEGRVAAPWGRGCTLTRPHPTNLFAVPQPPRKNPSPCLLPGWKVARGRRCCCCGSRGASAALQGV